MGLGPNKNTAKQEFVEAMRARLEAQEAGLGANVDEPSVNDNLGALGEAVYRILTVHAETLSNDGTDHAFWQWVEDVDTWLGRMASWQLGVNQAFSNWAAAGAADLQLKTAITGLQGPGTPPAPPAQLKGKLK
ncbi:MAG: hypothetical protein BM485_14685 [Desulfobulbaceae bacterium DB1]|nr:MAG: hypothetical protein BM485_14685 [Desulfobulbaceae bacterium DB1]